MAFPVEFALFVLLIVAAIVVARLRDLFAAAMLTGIFSLLSAGLFTLMDAVDVAFTEAAVGAGITTVLILGTLSVTARRENQQAFRLRPLLMVTVIGAALIYGTFDMPRYGDPDAPIHKHIAPEYIKGSEKLHIPNVVTSVLASYRGYDTLGETAVIFTAAIGVMMLLGGARPKWLEEAVQRGGATPPSTADGPMRMREKLVINVVVRVMIPFILLFAFYVQFHGDFGPGGGFQAGVIFAAGLILFALVFGLAPLQALLPPRAVEAAIAFGLLVYLGTGFESLLFDSNFLNYDALGKEHGQHYGILIIEAGVGITVAAAMTRFFYAFAGLISDADLRGDSESVN